MSGRRAIIRDRRFYWQYDDGRVSPVVMTERLISQLRQASYQTQVAHQKDAQHAD